MTPLTWVAFVLAGAAGAVVRVLVADLLSSGGAVAPAGAGDPGVGEPPFPWGTFVVNASGSLLLGVITGLALYHGFPKAPRLVLGTGFCGAYTTFSTFSVETVDLLATGALRAAWRNALATLVVCAGAAALGLALAAV
ncbi:MAG TPA: CrcB family protein [Acidimicrobiales bacterium]|nr:CrcB family protein [Acidimicrobiales bacterium]